tara:strand:- start:109 stop:717 length:609 start_codon:yes stop_codon:yes gene_type:complete
MLKKNIIQLMLIVFLIILTILFYQKYIISNDKNLKLVEKEINSQINNEKLVSIENKETENIIENLRYVSKDLFGNTYIINAQSAQIEEGKINQVQLFEVMAKIIQKDDEIIYINSSLADYNKINNNTIFKKNVNVKYGSQSIDADIIDLNFSKNLIKIKENVYYKNNNAKLSADKIEIDIESKKLKISMDKQNDKVEILAKY